MKNITVRDLRKYNACDEGIKLFKKLKINEIDFDTLKEWKCSTDEEFKYGDWLLYTFRLSNLKLINSSGFWMKSKFDKNGNRVYYENSYGFWMKSKFNKHGNRVHYEDSDGYWIKSKFDKNRNRVYYEDSDGYWIKRKFDKNGNEVYYEDSNGYIRGIKK